MESFNQSLQEIVLGAYLYGLFQKFGNRVFDLLTENKSLFSRFADFNFLYDILSDKTTPAKTIIAKAYRLSLPDDDTNNGLNPEEILKSVFCRLSDGGAMPDIQYYDIKPLSIDAIFPSAKAPKPDKNQLFSLFVNELRQVAKNAPDTQSGFLQVFDTLLKKYFWCIPTLGGGDVSLYDHIRISVAVTACLSQTPNAEKPFCMVAGDFSGIQKYIFAVARTSAKGVAKRLRARSFLVDATVSAVAHALTDKLNLPRMNILMLTGGKFYILMPNNEHTQTILSDFTTFAEAHFFDSYKGEIAINLASYCFEEDGLKNYSQTLTSLLRVLSKKKASPFASALTSNNGQSWNESAFAIYDDLANKTICTSCYHALINADDETCVACEDSKQLGGLLPKIKYIVYSKDAGDYRLFDNYYISVFADMPKNCRGYLVEQLNDFTINPAHARLPLSLRVMANRIPINDEGEVITFSELAEKSTGTKKLGILKADVDNLGYLFADGLRHGKTHYGTIARVNTLSRMLEYFFSGYVNELLSTQFTDIYSVFSGGDDLFVIGPWDKLPAFALTLQRHLSVLCRTTQALRYPRQSLSPTPRTTLQP